MTWQYLNKPFKSEDLQKLPENLVGFVYLITNLENNKKYVGQKKFYASKTIQKNKKKKKIKIESDWEKYWSSSEELKLDVEKISPDKFKREIIRLCLSKSEMNYYELEEQILRKVLLSEDYYNSYIGGRINRKHLKKK